uniref:Transmembrane protein 107 n=1 Tax=Fibrocapsa japonica TaxID=94617 RepID=A0A7S2UVK1_9STRA|mmetsp:Transcript_15580/g.22900  ORF Transcript_15580/g.22900 Transcript_15580/m.22900 type:complete len:141 (+) Transcript_15580:85-507(+)
MGLERRLIPARFLITLGHLIPTVMVMYVMEEQVYAGLSADATDKEIAAATAELEGAVLLAIICFLVDLLGLVAGFTIFSTRVNVFQIIAHFVGGIQVSTFIHEVWDYRVLWYIVVFCNVTTALVEIFVILRIFVVRALLY